MQPQNRQSPKNPGSTDSKSIFFETDPAESNSAETGRTGLSDNPTFEQAPKISNIKRNHRTSGPPSPPKNRSTRQKIMVRASPRVTAVNVRIMFNDIGAMLPRRGIPYQPGATHWVNDNKRIKPQRGVTSAGYPEGVSHNSPAQRAG